jgi:hypothetical protein
MKPTSLSILGILNVATQVMLPALTLGGLVLVSLKYPAPGVLLNFLAQPFWLHSTYRAWKKDGQIGMFINTVAFTVIAGFGVINYYFLD